MTNALNELIGWRQALGLRFEDGGKRVIGEGAKPKKRSIRSFYSIRSFIDAGSSSSKDG